MTDYQVLVKYGHSDAKALEICLDAGRGDAFSVGYIKMIRDLVETREEAKPFPLPMHRS